MKIKNLIRNFFTQLFFYIYNKKKIKGKNNKIFLKKALLKNTFIKVNGHNNTIVIGARSALKGCKISIKGDNHKLIIADDVVLYSCELKFEDRDCLISIGSHTRILHHGYITVAEPFTKIEIGDNCLFSIHSHVRNTDSHSILDLHSGERINPAKNIKIGNHIWVGAYVQILKGTHVHDNSIIGMRSLVTKDVPPNCLVAGTPAQIIRENVTWREERI